MGQIGIAVQPQGFPEMALCLTGQFGIATKGKQSPFRTSQIDQGTRKGRVQGNRFL